MNKSIRKIRETITLDHALRIVNSIAKTSTSHFESKIYYPYYWFTAECETRTLFGKKQFPANCLVDACNGLGATADPFEVEATSAASDAILAIRTNPEMAEKSAHRFLSHNLGRATKMIGNFNIDLESRGVIFKTYWLIKCEGTLVMVDATTGNLHKLNAKAA